MNPFLGQLASMSEQFSKIDLSETPNVRLTLDLKKRLMQDFSEKEAEAILARSEILVSEYDAQNPHWKTIVESSCQTVKNGKTMFSKIFNHPELWAERLKISITLTGE